MSLIKEIVKKYTSPKPSKKSEKNQHEGLLDEKTKGQIIGKLAKAKK